MQLQIFSLLALVAATSAAPFVVFHDKCGNSDPARACLFGIDQGGNNVGFTVSIGENNVNVNEVLGK
jgi:hypothetical protein